MKKFHILNFAKTTGIVAGTPFQVFDLDNVEICFIIFLQDNTTPQANNLDHAINVDGEEMAASNLAAADNTLYSVRPSNPGGVGPAIAVNPTLSIAADVDHYTGFPATDGAVSFNNILVKGRNITYTLNFDTIGAGQEFHADIYYWQRETA